MVREEADMSSVAVVRDGSVEDVICENCSRGEVESEAAAGQSISWSISQAICFPYVMSGVTVCWLRHIHSRICS